MAKRDDPEVEVLRLILQRNPDVPLSELGETLERVGVSTDDGSLNRLITAAGYIVVDDPDGTTMVQPKVVTDAGGAVKGARPPFPANPSAIVAMTIFGLLLVTIVGLTIVRHDNSADNASKSIVTATSTSVNLPATFSGTTTTTSLVVAPVGPGSDPALKVSGAVTDLFAQNGASLGTGPGGHSWTVSSGSWSVADGIASVSGGSKAGLNLATINLGTPDVRAQVKLPNDDAGAALAFRVVDSKNYWLIASAPQFGTFTVIEVVKGKVNYRANSGVTKAKPGVTIGVNAQGSSIEAYVNGAVVAHIKDADPRGDSIGLGTAVQENLASFSDLIYLTK